jgi:hypothetical protein
MGHGMKSHFCAYIYRQQQRAEPVLAGKSAEAEGVFATRIRPARPARVV